MFLSLPFVFLGMKVLVGLFGLLWKLYVGIIFTITAISFYPLITPFLYFSGTKRFAFYLMVFWSFVFRTLCLYASLVRGQRPVLHKPQVIIANHTSYLDIFLIYSLFPTTPFLIMGKSEILNYPLIKTYIKRLNIPVYRGSRSMARKSVEQGIQAIKEGWSLVIFPEGGIPDHDPPKLMRFKSGAFQIAKEAEVGILPVSFLNHHHLFSDPTNLLGRAHPGISKVLIHPLISKETVAKSSIDELKKMAFDQINSALK